MQANYRDKHALTDTSLFQSVWLIDLLTQIHNIFPLGELQHYIKNKGTLPTLIDCLSIS